MATQTEPKPTVNLTECDSNAFSIIGACVKAGRKAGWDAKRLSAFKTEAMSGDYGGVLQTAMKYFEVE